MPFIKKYNKKGKQYFYLVEKVKGKIKTLESYGTQKPMRYKPTLIKGFAEAELKNIPDESVNLIIIDPPYGIEFDTNHRQGESETLGQISLDNEKIFETFPDVIRECYRILKDDSALYCFSRWDVTDRFKAILSKYFRIKNRLNWVKNNWSMGDLSGSYAMQCEDIIFAVKGRHILKEGRPSDFLPYDRVSNQSLLHSNQKPLKLLDFLINNSSNRNDTVLDCYMGSGSTIVSAVNLGRKTIGIELNDKYIDIVKERLEKECYTKVNGIVWEETSPSLYKTKSKGVDTNEKE